MAQFYVVKIDYIHEFCPSMQSSVPKDVYFLKMMYKRMQGAGCAEAQLEDGAKEGKIEWGKGIGQLECGTRP